MRNQSEHFITNYAPETDKMEISRRDINIRETGRDSIQLAEGIRATVFSYKDSDLTETVAVQIDNFSRWAKDRRQQAVLGIIIPEFNISREQRSELIHLVGRQWMLIAYNITDVDKYKERIPKLQTTYTEMIAKIGNVEQALVDLEQKLDQNNQREIIIANSGVIIYPTLQKTWTIHPTMDRHEQIPEYLSAVYSIVPKPYQQMQWKQIYVGRENDCINFVMEQQKEAYGCTIRDYEHDSQILKEIYRMLDELEIILEIPEKEQYEHKRELAQRREQELEEALEALSSLRT